MNFASQEKKVLKFWKERQIFKKSLKKTQGEPRFVFYDGPITANAEPGVHMILARVFKDLIPRFKTMQGYYVRRKNGWDTHGLPVELEVEKSLDLNTKKDIEDYGIAKFNKACKESVQKYIPLFRNLSERAGYWVDMDNPYSTYDLEYIETLWWILKEIWGEELLYRDFKVVPWCPRCETSLSSHEVAQGYKKVEEKSITVKFELDDSPGTYLLAWTTTPWTLPANVALAVNSKVKYLKFSLKNYPGISDGEYITSRKDFDDYKEEIRKAESESEAKVKIIEEIKGEDLIGKKYKPLYPHQAPYKVIEGDFVSTEEGTGIVHVAPAFGEDDMKVGKENDLPILKPVDQSGRFEKEEPWSGEFVKEADPLIIKDLENRNLLFSQISYEHDYPFCWRCKTPLLYYARRSWFINMQKVKKNIIKNSQDINWIPSHIKEGRFGEWLKDLKDWNLSRERYWGTPLPIWQCSECGYQEVIGSKEDLLDQNFSSNKYFFLRHGESISNQKDIVSSFPEKIENPLTSKGKKQIKNLVPDLKSKDLDLIFSSDILRTKQTAKIISKELGIKAQYDERLREIDAGILNGEKISRYQSFWKEDLERFQKRVPQGENYTDVKKRVYQFIKEIDQKYEGKNILIISHECSLSMLQGALKGFFPKEILEYRRENRFEKGKFREVKFRNLPYNQNHELDFHRPFIDQLGFLCPKCGSKMTRVPEVIDVWFDSGAMPFAQNHYPFENKNLIDKGYQFPADFISEAIDQTRGWFYTLLAVSTLLKKGTPYRNVVCLGHILDQKGEKMSKSKGNIVKPKEVLEKYGADALRWYFYSVNKPGASKFFSEEGVEKCLKKFLMTLWNCFKFLDTYTSSKEISEDLCSKSPQTLLDKWIISRLNNLIRSVTKNLEKYRITQASRDIEEFVIKDLSLWFIRRSRKRFQDPSTIKEKEEAVQTLYQVLHKIVRVSAPFIPFISETIYRQLNPQEESVHLASWPEVSPKLIDKDLEEKMDQVREIVSLGLKERAQAGIKVRQPLPRLTIGKSIGKLEPELLNLIKKELNVKDLEFKVELKEKVKLSDEITPELKKEGMIREVIRQIQQMRKKAGYRPEHRILVRFEGGKELNELLSKNKDTILEQTKADSVRLGDKPKLAFDVEREIKVDQQKLWLGIKRI